MPFARMTSSSAVSSGTRPISRRYRRTESSVSRTSCATGSGSACGRARGGLARRRGFGTGRRLGRDTGVGLGDEGSLCLELGCFGIQLDRRGGELSLRVGGG